MRRAAAIAIIAAACSSKRARESAATVVIDAAPPVPDAHVWGHKTLDQLLAIGDPRPAFETDFTIIGHDVKDAQRIAGASSSEVVSGGDFGSIGSTHRETVYDFEITGLRDGEPISISPMLSLGSDDRYDVVYGFALELPASLVAQDEVMAGLRRKYGRPDHHLSDAGNVADGVGWRTPDRTIEATIDATGVKITDEHEVVRDEELEVIEGNDTTNAACDRYIAAWYDYYLCAEIPLADRIASGDGFSDTEGLWSPLRYHPQAGDGLDHTGEGADFAPSAKAVAAATRGCNAARAALMRRLAKTHCSVAR